MSEREFQPELDDELLSAYLDNELTVEERAAVEARLANDPDAQHLLHQLRSVSQSVQMLPLEGVGRDLSGEILRRVEAKKLDRGGTAGGGSSTIGEVTRRLPIFGSRRSWIWATLAVAAGLMIMVLERGDEKGKQLPAVAHNDSANADRSAGANGSREKRAETVVSAPSPSAVAEKDGEKAALRKLSVDSPSGSAAASSESDRLAVSAPEDTRKPTTSAGGEQRRRIDTSLDVSGDNKSKLVAGAEPQAMPRPASLPDEGAVARSAAAGAPAASINPGIEPQSTGDADDLVVVHVSAKPAAIRGGEFEKLLARNGVEFDSDAKAEDGIAGESLKKTPASSAESYDKSRNLNGANKSVDIVVVDAPRDVLAACMAELQHDESNFASVEVEQPAANDGAATAAPGITKQLGSELRQYNRGMNSYQQSAKARFYAGDSANKDQGQLSDESKRSANVSGGPSQNNQPVQNQRAAQKRCDGM
jgi:anti-sigma factor RsiW